MLAISVTQAEAKVIATTIRRIVVLVALVLLTLGLAVVVRECERRHAARHWTITPPRGQEPRGPAIAPDADEDLDDDQTPTDLPAW